MHSLARELAERISAGLQRKAITKCSVWSESYRMLGGKDYPGKWTFRHHPWLLGMHDSDAEMNVGQKSAQMGYTETVLNRTFYKIDIERVDCLYVLPAKTPDASDFSAARFDAALELSPHLARLFSDVKNVGHKRAGTTNLYIRGSKSRSGLKSVPVGYLVLDEVDEMEQDNIPLALERQSGQLTKQTWAISTPTIHNVGINLLYQNTTQEHFYFVCPHCSKITELVFPECLEVVGEHFNEDRVTESFLKCKECKTRLEHKEKESWLSTGRWIPSFDNRSARGFYINQLYSPTVKPGDLARSFLKAQFSPSEEQEFYNSKLGLEHVVDGAKITDEHIAACTKGYKNKTIKKQAIITMGVDIGKWLHYEIDLWHVPHRITTDINFECIPQVIYIGKAISFTEIEILMREYRVTFCVADLMPERRQVYDFANKFHGIVRGCFYGQGLQGKQVSVDKDEPKITVDRTSWLDLSMGRFRTNRIQIPLDTPEEYKVHLKNLVRVYEKDKEGNPVGRYVHTGEDHYAHARNYAEIALQFGMSLNTVQNITKSIV